jgi:hypothetical protein
MPVGNDLGDVLRELAGGSEWKALMVFRTGYPTTEALPSPRRSVEEVMVQGSRWTAFYVRNLGVCLAAYFSWVVLERD